jgi:hypothetical protein
LFDLPKLHADDIVINQHELSATASFVFADSVRFPLHISTHTLLRWVGDIDVEKIRSAILRRSPTLAELAASARTARRKKLMV